MLIEIRRKGYRLIRRCWQAAFALLLALVLVTEASPELSARALCLITDGVVTVVAGGAEKVDDSRILTVGAKSGGADVVLAAGKKVLIRRGDRELPATSRENETVSALLQREGVAVGPMEMVRVDLSDEQSIALEIASDFTYYETETVAVPFATVEAEDYSIPRGETRVTQEGRDGSREVTYEVVYADGHLASRQAVEEKLTPAVDRVVSHGTLVQEAREGDTIADVVKLEDGSGYLLMKSGDSLHFNSVMEVKCTAYTSNTATTGTITATGTTVHTGVVAVDKSVIPLGTRMFITTASGDYTYGMGHAEDTGVRGKIVDLFMNTYSECMSFGVRPSVIYMLDNM